MEALRVNLLAAALLLFTLYTVEGWSGWRVPYGPGGVNHHHHYHASVHNHYGPGGRGRYGGDSDEGGDSSHLASSSEEDQEDERIYRFSLGTNFGPYEYIGEDGVTRGFNYDLLVAVCKEANKHCAWVTDPYSNCWESDGEHGYPGVGLLADYYDACLGLDPTPERRNSFNFTDSYTQNYDVAVYYNEGSPHYTENDPTDLTGKKIGFVRGWVWDKQCLYRQEGFKGNHKDEFTALLFESDWAMLDALRAGEIDAMLAVKSHGRTNSDEQLKIHAADPAFQCSDGGSSLMARYSKQDVIDWWNDAFHAMQENGNFQELCEQAKTNHGHMGDIRCV